MYKFMQVSSLEKVFLDYKLPKKDFEKLSVLKNESFSYQIAYKYDAENDKGFPDKKKFKISIKSKLKKFISIRTVGNVPAELTYYPESCDDDYIKKAPGLFPDPLFEIDGTCVLLDRYFCHSFWISVDLDGTVEAGEYPIDIIFEAEDEKIVKRMNVKIINALLPEQEMIFTQWFHCDCIASHYKTPVFSKKHWKLIESFARVAVKNGINMILTPIFTPALDTEVGGERPTVQLVGVKVEKGKYSFDFTLLKKWIDLMHDCGIKYFEMAHLFTQWGAKASPKIVAEVDGVKKRIFGWDTPAVGGEYERFLDEFLPELVKFLKAEKVDKSCYFHVSDEPHGDMLEDYMAAKNIVSKHIEGFKMIDALSSIDFYKKGAVELPIPATNSIESFIEEGIEDLWAYYCVGQNSEVCNRFFDMPSYRNRAIGLQFYKFDIKGFLQWGYNFYYSRYSRKVINPYLTTDADSAFVSGDSFSVYPGEKGAIESLRIKVFYDALQDVRAMKLLESYIGKDKVVEIIEDTTKLDIAFNRYPKSAATLLKVREKINKKIEEFVK